MSMQASENLRSWELEGGGGAGAVAVAVAMREDGLEWVSSEASGEVV